MPRFLTALQLSPNQRLHGLDGGPGVYDYHFPRRAVLDSVITRSWATAGTLFAADATHLARQSGELLGMEVAFSCKLRGFYSS